MSRADVGRVAKMNCSKQAKGTSMNDVHMFGIFNPLLSLSHLHNLSLEPNFIPFNADVTFGRSLTLKSRFIVGEVGAGGKNGGASKQHFSEVGRSSCEKFDSISRSLVLGSEILLPMGCVNMR